MVLPTGKQLSRNGKTGRIANKLNKKKEADLSEENYELLITNFLFSTYRASYQIHQTNPFPLFFNNIQK